MLFAEIIIFLLIFLIVITQRVSIRVTKNTTTSIYVHFIFFAVRISNSKKPNSRLIKIFKNRFFIKSIDKYLLPKTNIKIYALEQDTTAPLPKIIANTILTNTLLTYISAHAKSVIYTPGGNNAVDVEISFILYHAIISLFLGQYYKIKSKF